MVRSSDSLKDYVSDISNKHKDLLKIAHINAESLNNDIHYSEFMDTFSNSGINVIAVSETFYNESSQIQLPNYRVFNANRIKRRGGGVALYIAMNLQSKLLYATKNDGYEPEYIFVETVCGSSKVLLICMYRPPDVGHMDLFINDLYSYLPNYKYCILCGDLNAGFGNGSAEATMIEESLFMCNLTRIPYDNTFRTHYCETNLDVIASNMNDFLVEYGQTRAPGFSYHDFIYAVYDLSVPPSVKQKLTFRDFKNINIEQLRIDVEEAPWEQVVLSSDIDTKVGKFNELIAKLMDKHVPVKNIIVKHRPTPWMNREIRRLISKRNKARKRHSKNKTEENYERFRQLRNKTKQAIRNAKIRYYHSILNKASTKDIWKGIRSLGISSKSNNIDSQDFPVTANELNAHYSSVSSVDNPQVIERTIDEYLNKKEPENEKFHFKYVHANEIRKAVLSITSKAVGIDRISVAFLKLVLDWLLPAIEHIFNFCLQSSVFPKIWKMSNIKPIPKCKNPTECKDFRPVSILCVLPKALEKLVHEQISEYIDCYKLSNPLQSGFKKGHSTTTALIKVTDDLRKGIDQKKVSILVLLDFSKAFDRVHHKLLLAKLKTLGFSLAVIKWVEAYLCERLQRVLSGDSYVSDWVLFEVGVPQGSVLGPLLFSLYVNDLSDVLQFCQYHMYADDLQIYINFSIQDIGLACDKINSDLKNIVSYSTKHNLILNIEKTYPIFVGSNAYINIVNSMQVPEILVGGAPLPFQSKVVNLGVTFDSTLCWNSHGIRVINRVFSTLAQVRRNFIYLPPDIRLKIVQSLIFPIFDYCNVLFTDMLVDTAVKVQRAQNACIRFVTGTRRDEHITPSYISLNILKIQERRKLAVASWAWTINKYHIPLYLHENYVSMSSIHSRSNRFTHQTLQIPRHRTEKFGNSFLIYSCRLWNELNIGTYLNYSTSNVLKRNLKDKFVHSYCKLPCKL